MDSMDPLQDWCSIFEVCNLTKNYEGRGAVDAISLSIKSGEILGLVGESGSGKSTLGKLLLRLIEPSSGMVYYNQVNITALKPKELKPFRRHMQMVFQHPFTSLNPRMTVKEMIDEAFYIHQLKGSAEEVISLVGLDKSSLQKYPHQFSGGQQQRIAIARALAVDPQFIVFDEPLSSLDVSIQAQIVTTIKELQVQKKLTYLFITHDLTMTQHLCDRVAVMHEGKIVELGETREVFARPKQAYTKKLIDSIPSKRQGKSLC